MKLLLTLTRSQQMAFKDVLLEHALTKGATVEFCDCSQSPAVRTTLADLCLLIDTAVPNLGAAAELRVALEESVKLQTHYAKLLNEHDGGERIGFKDAAAWIARLRETGKLK
jgi:hypothetical protein